ncbi:MAG TPA: LysE family transporter [Candidatus Nanoarchaeia archaeon]|nr:LysE family transporter [Candidatus Nanoarchaeia archaeon]
MLQGLVIGFSIAAPVGPIGILCIQRTLLRGRKNGLVSGLGAATADAVYGSIAGFGLTFISDAILSVQFWIRLLGGIFLCYLGIRAVFSKPKEQVKGASEANLVKDFSSTFLLAITNPIAIVYFAAIFSALAGTAITNYATSGLFVTGVFLGSLLWWVILSGSTGFFIHKFDVKKLRYANIISGITIIAFGVYFLLSLTNIL